MANRATGTLTAVAAVQRDLARIRQFDPELARSGLAAAALAMARELDDPENSATSKSMCAKALLELRNRLEELIPKDQEKDGIDELSARRAARRAGSPGT